MQNIWSFKKARFFNKHKMKPFSTFLLLAYVPLKRLQKRTICKGIKNMIAFEFKIDSKKKNSCITIKASSNVHHLFRVQTMPLCFVYCFLFHDSFFYCLKVCARQQHQDLWRRWELISFLFFFIPFFFLLFFFAFLKAHLGCASKQQRTKADNFYSKRKWCQAHFISFNGYDIMMAFWMIALCCAIKSNNYVLDLYSLKSTNTKKKSGNEYNEMCVTDRKGRMKTFEGHFKLHSFALLLCFVFHLLACSTFSSSSQLMFGFMFYLPSKVDFIENWILRSK